MWRTLALLALASPAIALGGDKRAAVMDLLNAFEEPIREADLKALGEGVDAELMSIADDATVPSTRRGNAVVALQYYKTDAVRSFLEAHLASSKDPIVRRKAAYSLAAWGAPAVPHLERALADHDVQLRIAAAHALGTIADEAANRALEARLSAESEAAVKAAIQKSLGGAH